MNSQFARLRIKILPRTFLSRVAGRNLAADSPAVLCWMILFSWLCSLSFPNVAAQETLEPEVNAQARELLREAADALVQEDHERVLSNAVKAAGLLPQDVRVQQRAAELLYRSGHVEQSLKPFDKAVELEPSKANHNWQRGIALATAGDFRRGAEQFQVHHRVNPDDVENSAWYFLCLAKSSGIEAARKSLLPSRGDGRLPMMSILEMYQEKLSPEQLLEGVMKLPIEGDQRQTALFYANLYIGLYFDAVENKEDARRFLQRSAECDISGYMVDAARVYLSHRFKEDDVNVGSDQP